MSLYITFLQPSSSTKWKHEKVVLEQMAELYTDGHIISNTSVMAQLCRNMVQLHKQKIKGIVFASHGGPTSFYIGRDWISLDHLTGVTKHPLKAHIIPALKSLRPLFAPHAWVRIQACECGANKAFPRKLSEIMGVPVFSWTGKIYPELTNDKVTGLVGGDNSVVCTSTMCHEW
jgi:hypothetical protein